MPQRVEYNGQVHEFPDTFTDADIQSALSSEEQSDKRTVGGFAGNLLKSGGQLVGNIAGAVAHPLETGKAILNLAAGTVEKMTPGFPQTPQTQSVDALGRLYKSRYGSLDDIARTIYEDPVGVAADVATAAGGVGAVAKGASVAARAAGLTRVADAAGTVARTAGTVSGVADPLRIPGRIAAPVLNKTGVTARLYESALKIPPSWGTPAEAKAIAQTGIREGVPVTAGGLDKLYDLILDLNGKARGKIADAAARGVTVDAERVATRADQAAGKFQEQVNASDDLRAIEASKQTWRKEQGARPAVAPSPTGLYDASGRPVMTAAKPAMPARQIPADEAQAIKTGTYRQLKDRAFGELKAASIESQKALARGIKEELAAAIPEIGAINAREGKLLDLEGALERGIRRIGNHQLFGIGTPIAAGAVAEATGSAKAGMVAGVIRAMLDNPQVKSKLAIALQMGAERGGSKITFGTAASRVQEYLNSLESPSPAPSGQLSPALSQ